MSTRPVTSNEFNERLQTAKSRIFRYEGLPDYNVPGDRKIYEEFINGVPTPPLDSGLTMQWFGSIRGHSERGVTFQRLRLLPNIISPYLRYEIEWCYSFSRKFGEETRFVYNPPGIDGDFYSIDGTTLIWLRYSKDVSFLGFEEELDKQLTEVLLSKAYTQWDQAQTLETFLRAYRRKPL